MTGAAGWEAERVYHHVLLVLTDGHQLMVRVLLLTVAHSPNKDGLNFDIFSFILLPP